MNLAQLLNIKDEVRGGGRLPEAFDGKNDALFGDRSGTRLKGGDEGGEMAELEKAIKEGKKGERKDNQKEAMAGVDKGGTSGSAGVSSLAAVGGGGGVGLGPADQQLAVANQANEILKRMLTVLQRPPAMTLLGMGDDAARLDMIAKLSDDEKQAMNQGFINIVQNLRAGHIKQDEAKEKAQGLMDGFGEMAAQRKFKAMDNKAVKGAVGRVGGRVNNIGVGGRDLAQKQRLFAAKNRRMAGNAGIIHGMDAGKLGAMPDLIKRLRAQAGAGGNQQGFAQADRLERIWNENKRSMRVDAEKIRTAIVAQGGGRVRVIAGGGGAA